MPPNGEGTEEMPGFSLAFSMGTASFPPISCPHENLKGLSGREIFFYHKISLSCFRLYWLISKVSPYKAKEYGTTSTISWAFFGLAASWGWGGVSTYSRQAGKRTLPHVTSEYEAVRTKLLVYAVRMVGWHHWHDGHGFGWTQGVGDGQGGLACCGSWGRKESDTTEWLNWRIKSLRAHTRIKYCIGQKVRSGLPKEVTGKPEQTFWPIQSISIWDSLCSL